MNKIPDPFLEKSDYIDKQAYEMTLTVLQHPALRSSYTENLPLLKERFSGITAELVQPWPDINRKVREQISKIVLDLNFVATESNLVSLRIAV